MSNVLNSKAAMVGVGVIALAAVVYFFGKKISAAAGDAVDAISKVNEGTPYEGAGIVGTLGNVVNRASGGLFQTWGEKLGSSIFDVFNQPYDPNNARSPKLLQAAGSRSPTRPEDSATSYMK